jgi:hypothetical protein
VSDDTTPDLAKMERDAAAALVRWLDEHPVLADDGSPAVWADGMPVALDVLHVLVELEAWVAMSESEKPA